MSLLQSPYVPASNWMLTANIRNTEKTWCLETQTTNWIKMYFNMFGIILVFLQFMWAGFVSKHTFWEHVKFSNNSLHLPYSLEKLETLWNSWMLISINMKTSNSSGMAILHSYWITSKIYLNIQHAMSCMSSYKNISQQWT